MRRSTAPTLQDVAREAGVTAMTVSVVLNGARSATRVSAATRVRIEEAAARLRYRPNGVARGLSRRRMDTLGVVAATDGGAGDVNLYFLEILNGILASATASGQNITVFSVSDWSQDEPRILRSCDGRVDGLIFIAPHLSPGFPETLTNHGPFVTIHGTDVQPEFYGLDVDDRGGAMAAVTHLLSQGHRRIAHLTGTMTQRGAQQRLEGYRRALSEANISVDETLIVPGDFMIESGRRGVNTLLARPGSPPTAIFCASDAVAYGCMEVLAGRGLRVPADMSVVGFDDVLLARMTSPHLTTVCQPFRAMGRRAVEMLLSQLGDAGGGAASQDGAAAVSPMHTEVFPTELILRGSVGPPPLT